MAHVTKGNVFEDLGFSREDAADLAMKFDLASDVRKFIERQGLTQVQAAEFFKVPRRKIGQSRATSSTESALSTSYACWRRQAGN